MGTTERGADAGRAPEHESGRLLCAGIRHGGGNGSDGILRTLFFQLEKMPLICLQALLALRTFSTSISLGSIRLYQSTADSLLSSIRTLTNNLESSVQSIFYMAAFFEMMRVTEKLSSMGRCGLKETSQKPVELLDYEAYRFEGGMKIEAKNVGFTYPGAEKPVLENINLVIEPGTTLAVVGFNGGGEWN